MKFAAHCKHDREITLWLSDFMGKALPGVCFPEEVCYGISPGDPALGERALILSMTLDSPDGQVDVSVHMTNDSPDGSPKFDRVEATQDVQDPEGRHLKTLFWNDGERAWCELEMPPAHFHVIQGGLKQVSKSTISNTGISS